MNYDVITLFKTYLEPLCKLEDDYFRVTDGVGQEKSTRRLDKEGVEER